MSQEDPSDPSNCRVVQYASRTLTEVETRYHQIEKEELAVLWALEHFHLYIYGRPVEVVTDNTVVALVFGNPHSKPKARLENWSLRLQRYEFSIRHKPGESNMADYLSRHPQSAVLTKPTDECEAYVNLICDSSRPPSISRELIASTTLSDTTLTEVKKMLRGEAHQAPQLFVAMRNDLCVSSDGLVLRRNTIVIPTALKNDVIRIAHFGHQGTTKTLALMRRHVWFADMDSMVEAHIKSCASCVANTDTTRWCERSRQPRPKR